MLGRRKILLSAIATGGLLAGSLALPATSATAATTWNHVCQGSIKKPGHAPAMNLNLTVRGVCFVDRGPTTVAASVIVTRGSVLLAAFGRHDSHLVVSGNILVRKGATLILGCEAAHFACIDDPHQKKPTLNSRSTVDGSLIATGALGVVVHLSRIGHDVLELGGGGGLTCQPHGAFAQFQSPVYSDYEDNWIGGRITVRHLRSCWFGALRNWIGVTGTFSSNRMADPDAMEVNTNTVIRNLVCWRNHPKVQFGDSHGKPNRVGLHAYFQCGFHRLVPNPAGQHKHFEHISVHLH
jgi:hypothetical protein